MKHHYSSLSLWERVRVRVENLFAVLFPLTPTLSQRERGFKNIPPA
jgi:hypothetical protein